MGDELVSSSLVNGVSLPGSYGVGVSIYEKAIRNMTRAIQLEMGGKNPVIVLNDADIDTAVKLAAAGGFGLTGQACTATSRIIVEDGIADAFAAALSDAASNWSSGTAWKRVRKWGQRSARTNWKPTWNTSASAKAKAKLLAGGDVAKEGGHFVKPTVFDFVSLKMRIAQEEIFGPVIGIMRARDFDDAIEKANSIGFGLSAGIVTNNLQRAFHFAKRIEAGVVKINEPTTGLALQAPFGGFKHSSANTFKEQGPAAIEFYTRTKTVYVGHG